ncbi:hypothetical protein DE146DRAFT_614117 [Phaeosphaeria sp. MPI-PUGE-AT-0046c]|nr:hypothetical protein DE146DRAFT_614117 [Phaeosphaeria sp. MPI-PUGE-AT-0046c]
MDASMATYQARLASFQGAPAAKTRRTSSRSKKAAPKSKAAWPLSAPSSEELAHAGFVWKPTSVSPDNVQCWACGCSLDGWEETDVPSFEHLTHSPHCGFAVVTAIKLRSGDPGRAEEDPIGEAMIQAREYTFGDLWPLDTAAGYPGVEQLAAAGWHFDPAEGMPDGVTCPYCQLSLDAWDAGDDPLEEHRRRQPDCYFFTLSEHYHPTKPAPKKAKRVTKGKRASTRSSTASNVTTNTTTTTKKSKRGKKRSSEAMEEDTQISEPAQDTSKRMRFSSMSSFPDDLPIGTPKKTPTHMETEPFTMSSLPADPFTMSSLPANLLAGTPKKTPSRLREVEGQEIISEWQPTDMDVFFANPSDVPGFMNEVVIDAGLDQLTLAGTTPEEIRAALLAGLTETEKTMTIEQWVLYNAKRGEEKLRIACEAQIEAFEMEGKRALSALEAIATY